MTPGLVVSRIDEAELCRIAELVALSVRPGEAIALSGELGAGKTTFARAFVRAILDDAEAEIPSPTFGLLQTYESQRFPVFHLDLYRLSGPQDISELVSEDDLGSAVTVVEWPDRALDLLPLTRLDVRIAETDAVHLRTVELTGHAAWGSRLARLDEVRRFLLRELGEDGWRETRLCYLQGDASARAYARLRVGETTHVLMNAPRMPDGPPIRNGMPYSRIAHLAEDVRPFVAIADALEKVGLAVPHVRAQDVSRGLLLLEDMGDLTFGKAVEAGHDQRELWTAAVDALIALRAAGARTTPPAGGMHELLTYDYGALTIEAELLLDWYWPMLMGAPVSQSFRDEFTAAWHEHFEQLASLPKGWVLRDFHSPNLMWRAEQDDVARVGVLDFQDALLGPWAYDLASLLQDARVDVPCALETDLFARYCDRVAAIEPDFDRTNFSYAYAALGAQRNTKILGIFARLARRDAKTIYLQHIPRIWRYLERNLQAPSLASLRAWYDRHFPQPVRTTVPPP